jgi:hypothetical protein
MKPLTKQQRELLQKTVDRGGMTPLQRVEANTAQGLERRGLGQYRRELGQMAFYVTPLGVSTLTDLRHADTSSCCLENADGTKCRSKPVPGGRGLCKLHAKRLGLVEAEGSAHSVTARSRAQHAALKKAHA